MNFAAVFTSRIEAELVSSCETSERHSKRLEKEKKKISQTSADYSSK